jgi:hypothetical protein
VVVEEPDTVVVPPSPLGHAAMTMATTSSPIAWTREFMWPLKLECGRSNFKEDGGLRRPSMNPIDWTLLDVAWHKNADRA